LVIKSASAPKAEIKILTQSEAKAGKKYFEKIIETKKNPLRKF